MLFVFVTNACSDILQKENDISVCLGFLLYYVLFLLMVSSSIYYILAKRLPSSTHLSPEPGGSDMIQWLSIKAPAVSSVSLYDACFQGWGPLIKVTSALKLSLSRLTAVEHVLGHPSIPAKLRLKGRAWWQHSPPWVHIALSFFKILLIKL